MSNCEAGIDATRLKLYEETKNMTTDQRIARVNNKAQKLAEEFGFTIVPSANSNPSSTAS